jgi:hypothetical protein
MSDHNPLDEVYANGLLRPSMMMSAFDRWVMCDRKRQFVKEKTANKWARQIDGRSYLCPVCNCFHITKRK